MRPLAFVSALVLLALASCGAPPLQKLTFQMDWTHETEFLGFYVAQDEGFFRQAGLDVTLLEGPAGTDIPDILASKQVDAAQMGLTMFLEASRRNPDLQAVMAVFQISPRVILTRASAGIRGPKDLEGKTLGVKSASWAEVVKRIMVNAGASPEKLKPVAVRASDVDKFYRGEIDAWTGFAGSEPVDAQLAGVPVDLLFADDFGIGGYDELVVLRKSSLAADRALWKRFVGAIAQGWNWAASHPEAVTGIVGRRRPEVKPEAIALSWKALRPLVMTGRFPVGWIENARWPGSPESFTTDLLEQP